MFRVGRCGSSRLPSFVWLDGNTLLPFDFRATHVAACAGPPGDASGARHVRDAPNTSCSRPTKRDLRRDRACPVAEASEPHRAGTPCCGVLGLQNNLPACRLLASSNSFRTCRWNATLVFAQLLEQGLLLHSHPRAAARDRQGSFDNSEASLAASVHRPFDRPSLAIRSSGPRAIRRFRAGSFDLLADTKKAHEFRTRKKSTPCEINTVFTSLTNNCGFPKEDETSPRFRSQRRRKATTFPPHATRWQRTSRHSVKAWLPRTCRAWERGMASPWAEMRWDACGLRPEKSEG